MTPKELYDWAVENDCEACDLSVRILEGGTEYIRDFDETELTLNKKSEQITIDV